MRIGEPLALVCALPWDLADTAEYKQIMTFKLGLRDGGISAAVFGAVMFALVSVDARVREQVSDMVTSSASVSPWSSRFSELADALWSAARHQSIENAPLLVFATVGVVLTLFMLRS